MLGRGPMSRSYEHGTSLGAFCKRRCTRVDDLYSHDEFFGDFPVWFVVMEQFTKFDAERGHFVLTQHEPGAFCGSTVAGHRCIALFSDDDLAQRNASLYPGTVPVPMFTPAEVISLLDGFYPDHFHSVVLDPGENQKWTKTRKVIPEFIESLRGQA